MTDTLQQTRGQVRFPGTAFESHAAFEAYRQANQSLLDGRYAFEQSLATSETHLVRAGSCALCLRPANFTSAADRGDADASGRHVPHWREQQACDCERALSHRARAIVHFMLAAMELRPWARLLLIGRPAPTNDPLAEQAYATTSVPMFDPAPNQGCSLAVASGRFHFAVCDDYLQHVPPLDAALAEIQRALVDGGVFVFTVPFRHLAATTVSRLDHGAPDPSGPDTRAPDTRATERDHEVHEIGWDILDRLKQAGFSSAAAHLYWSNELGYLGPMNMVFSAVK